MQGKGSTLAKEAAKRRTFAIISHPDAGKTTLTEKLLLYGGAIHLAGSVRSRRAARHATSDWMELEKQRGISVTSSVLHFRYEGFHLNLLDTPGHQDFSEDTYRTLVAADSAIMLLDNRKGVEEQTRKLFDVCKLRRIPIFTFVNKCDRAGEAPLKLLDDIEADLGILCSPITWPVLDGDRFLGVLDRLTDTVHLFQRGEDHGQARVEAELLSLHDDELGERLGARTHDQLLEDIELLDGAGTALDPERVHLGEVSPTFFGSALTNFGVEPFLKRFLEFAPAPQPRESTTGPVVDPTDPDFSGFIFKIQANMDPKHRDRIAFLRVCSGRFEPGLTVTNLRSGKEVRLAIPQQIFAQERIALEEAWPGDVVGLHDRGSLRIGDTLSATGKVHFADIPRFSPEHFAKITVDDPLRRKRLDRGLRQLSEEGAAQVFFADSLVGPSPILGAVGLLQYDVILHRLEHEYGVKARLENLPFTRARWVKGSESEITRLTLGYDRALVHDARGAPMVLFKSPWSMERTISEEDDLEFFQIAP